MKIQIEIPEEFTGEFNQNRFQETLERLIADAELVAGRYEKETAQMLIKAFKNGEIVE